MRERSEYVPLEPVRPPRKKRRWPWWMVGLLVFAAALIAAYEMIASPFQAMLLAGYGKRLTWTLNDGPSAQIVFPGQGPYDVRLGYNRIPEFTQRLTQRGYVLAKQARISDDMNRVGAFGLFLPYNEKSVAGVTLRGCNQETLFSLPQPKRHYARFEDIPPVIANTLLYIENRELLDPNHPQRNPAVEWDRFAQAVLEKAVQVVQPGRKVPGGSTLATQIEKYRHTPDGLTLSGGDKLTQMASASLRAYIDGTDTRVTRRRLVQAYLNTVPLSAAPGHGEVIGTADALDAWFGLDFDEVNRLVRGPAISAESARAYKHVLALLIAQRRPSFYLIADRAQLETQADIHLRMLAKAGIINEEIRDLALSAKLQFRKPAPATATKALTFVENKAANALRADISRQLGLSQLYDLDRLDLNVDTTLHASAQRAVTQQLKRLNDPAAVAELGLYGHYLLEPDDDLTKIIFSFTLHELTKDGAVVRIQADNLNQPFDINQGAKLDMGSSAKLRTLITYLEIIADLHKQFAGKPAAQLAKVSVPTKDVLTAWVIAHLRGAGDHSLHGTLEAAMGRRYSANPSEGFYTGGGVHHFNNFHSEDNHKVMDLWESTRNSVNLPFIRLMRDVIHHLTYRAPSTAARVLADVNDPKRDTYLIKFADSEGRAFLARFHKKYRGLTPAQIADNLLNHLTAHPKRLAAVFRYLEPQADLAAFTQLMRGRLVRPGAYDDKDMAYLFETYGPDKFNLADRGYITQIHPLELWLAAYLRQNPAAKWEELVQKSARERVEVYDWLFKTGRKNTQDNRIQSLMEIESFQELHKRWRKLGYPFNSLVPSYASAIGSSADRPAALAEMMGVIRNDGVKLPAVNIRQLEFGADTPYHTVFRRVPVKPERIFDPMVAQVVRKALLDVVENGTARRIKGAFPTAEGSLAIGGKTGTGDHRMQVIAAGGRVIEEKVMNRVATFAFFMGERYFGVITAFVPGEQAANYHFTSGLPVQLLKTMAPILRPLVLGQENADLPWAIQAAAFDAEAKAEFVARAEVAKKVAVVAPKPLSKPVPVAPKPVVATRPAVPVAKAVTPVVAVPPAKPVAITRPVLTPNAPSVSTGVIAPAPVAVSRPLASPAPSPVLTAPPAVPPVVETPKAEKKRNPWVSPEYEYLF
jgi:membrane peptidoglycan carboxypeptidase